MRICELKAAWSRTYNPPVTFKSLTFVSPLMYTAPLMLSCEALIPPWTVKVWFAIEVPIPTLPAFEANNTFPEMFRSVALMPPATSNL